LQRLDDLLRAGGEALGKGDAESGGFRDRRTRHCDRLCAGGRNVLADVAAEAGGDIDTVRPEQNERRGIVAIAKPRRKLAIGRAADKRDPGPGHGKEYG
jgi:hypothetical protein